MTSCCSGRPAWERRWSDWPPFQTSWPCGGTSSSSLSSFVLNCLLMNDSSVQWRSLLTFAQINEYQHCLFLLKDFCWPFCRCLFEVGDNDNFCSEWVLALRAGSPPTNISRWPPNICKRPLFGWLAYHVQRWIQMNFTFYLIQLSGNKLLIRTLVFCLKQSSVVWRQCFRCVSPILICHIIWNSKTFSRR